MREIAWRAIDDVDDWHHHHETLARAALEAHWRRARRRVSRAREPTELSLAEAVCLTLVAREPRHGWSIVKALAPDGEIGRVWSLSRPLTYRALDALASARAHRAARLRAGCGPAAHDLARDAEGPARVARVAAAAGRATRATCAPSSCSSSSSGAPAAELARAQLDGVRAGLRRACSASADADPDRRRRPLAARVGRGDAPVPGVLADVAPLVSALTTRHCTRELDAMRIRQVTSARRYSLSRSRWRSAACGSSSKTRLDDLDHDRPARLGRDDQRVRGVVAHGRVHRARQAVRDRAPGHAR